MIRNFLDKKSTLQTAIKIIRYTFTYKFLLKNAFILTITKTDQNFTLTENDPYEPKSGLDVCIGTYTSLIRLFCIIVSLFIR